MQAVTRAKAQQQEAERDAARILTAAQERVTSADRVMMAAKAELAELVDEPGETSAQVG